MATYEEWQSDLERQKQMDAERSRQQKAAEEQAWLEEQQRQMVALQQQSAQPIPLSNLVNPRQVAPVSQQQSMGAEVNRIDRENPLAERNANLSALLAGTPTEGGWTQGESGRPMLTMVGKGGAGFQSLGKYATPQEFINAAPDVFAKVNPDLVGKYKQQSPQEIALADMSQQAMDVLQNPNATIAQKQAAFKLMQPPGTSLADQKTQAEIQKLQAQTEKARQGEIDKSQIPGTIENERVLKRQDIARKGQMVEQSALDDAKKLQGFLKQAIDQTDWNSAGLIGQVLTNIGGTDAADLESVLDSIKAKIGFNELQQMRKESPTGGALGQVAVRELEFLQSVEGSLKQKQSPAQLKKNLQDILQSATNLEQDLQKNPPKWDFNAAPRGAPVPIRSEEEASRLPKGTVVIINGRRAVVE